MGTRSPFFKKVKNFYCLYCNKEYPLTDSSFKYVNKHGWGYCGSCWKWNLPNAKVFVPPIVAQFLSTK